MKLCPSLFLQLIASCCFLFYSPLLNAAAKKQTVRDESSSPHDVHRPFVVFCPPKCGTHLAGKALSLMVGKSPAYHLTDLGSGTLMEALNIIASDEAQGRFVVSHHFTKNLLKTLVNQGYKVIFVVRDPRDQLISAVNWIREGQWFWLPISKMGNLEDQISEAITGNLHGWASVESNFLAFEQQLRGISSKHIYRAHYEKLVGVNGKGSVEEQTDEIVSISNFIEFSINNEKIKYVADNLFGGTITFRDGTIGKWKSLFTENQKKEFKIRYSPVLIRLGYEKDSKW